MSTVSISLPDDLKAKALHLANKENMSLAPAKKDAAKRLQKGPTASVEQSPFNAWLAKCDHVAELWEGPFDSAADLRRIRDEE